MLFAIACVCDQTICYLDADGRHTTKHPEVKLYADVQEASHKCVRMSMEQTVFLKNGGHPDHPIKLTDEQIVERYGYWLEAVEDEAEFRAREDTW